MTLMICPRQTQERVPPHLSLAFGSAGIPSMKITILNITLNSICESHNPTTPTNPTNPTYPDICDILGVARWKALFKTPLNRFDVLIALDPASLPLATRCQHVLYKPSPVDDKTQGEGSENVDDQRPGSERFAEMMRMIEAQTVI